MPKYIDPVSDFGFKHLFGKEANKDLLIALLNELLLGYKTVQDLVYKGTERTGDHADNGSVIFDLTCIDQDGNDFIIEVQRSRHVNLKKRMLYYASKIASEQAPRGKRKEWNYNVKEIYVIILMDGFSFSSDRSGYQSEQFIHPIWLCDRTDGQVFYEDLGFIYVELANFTKEESELRNELDNWLFVLKNMAKMQRLSAYLRKPIFSKLFDLAEYGKLSKEDKNMYDRSLRNKWDAYMYKEQMLIDQKEKEDKERELAAREEVLSTREKDLDSREARRKEELAMKEKDLASLEAKRKEEAAQQKLKTAEGFLKAGTPIEVITKVLDLTEQEIKNIS